jgi:GntR family transcriptional regulator
MADTTVLQKLESLLDELRRDGAEKLPPERELAVRFAVSRSQIRRRLEQLEAEGRIVRVLGRSGGSYLPARPGPVTISPAVFSMRSDKISRSLNDVKGVPQMLAEQGHTHETRILREQREVVPGALAATLGVQPGTEVLSLLRLRLADGVPLSLECTYLTEERFPGLFDHSPIEALYQLFHDVYGVTIHTTDETIESVVASTAVAETLGIRRGSPVLLLRRIGYDVNGEPVEAAVDYFRTDRTRLTVRTVVHSTDSPAQGGPSA